jgi:hypothetical protein
MNQADRTPSSSCARGCSSWGRAERAAGARGRSCSVSRSSCPPPARWGRRRLSGKASRSVRFHRAAWGQLLERPSRQSVAIAWVLTVPTLPSDAAHRATVSLGASRAGECRAAEPFRYERTARRVMLPATFRERALRATADEPEPTNRPGVASEGERIGLAHDLRAQQVGGRKRLAIDEQPAMIDLAPVVRLAAHETPRVRGIRPQGPSVESQEQIRHRYRDLAPAASALPVRWGRLPASATPSGRRRARCAPPAGAAAPRSLGRGPPLVPPSPRQAARSPYSSACPIRRLVVGRSAAARGERPTATRSHRTARARMVRVVSVRASASSPCTSRGTAPAPGHTKRTSPARAGRSSRGRPRRRSGSGTNGCA